MPNKRTMQPMQPMRTTHTQSRTTTVTFTAEELTRLAKILTLGQAMLQTTYSDPVVGRLKAAMTRVGVPTPKGL